MIKYKEFYNFSKITRRNVNEVVELKLLNQYKRHSYIKKTQSKEGRPKPTTTLGEPEASANDIRRYPIPLSAFMFST